MADNRLSARLCGSLPKEGRLPAAWQDAACLQLLLARLEGLDQVQLCFLESVSSGLLALRGGTADGPRCQRADILAGPRLPAGDILYSWTVHPKSFYQAKAAENDFYIW